MTETERRLAAFKLPKRDRSPIYEWARKHIVLPESYATSGPFNVRLSPWLIPIFDALQNPLVRRVHFRKAVQIGGTLVADVWVPWLICNDAGPISWTMQTDEMIDPQEIGRASGRGSVVSWVVPVQIKDKNT